MQEYFYRFMKTKVEYRIDNSFSQVLINHKIDRLNYY